MMSVSCRNEDNARAEIQSCKSTDAKHRVQFYDSWAENYEKVCVLPVQVLCILCDALRGAAALTGAVRAVRGHQVQI